MMRIATLVFWLMATTQNANAGDAKLAGLEDLRWEYRVILVLAGEPHASRALANLQEFAVAIEERDIAWFVLAGEALHTNYNGALDPELRENLVAGYFTPKPSDTAVLLIGKDGQVKSESSELNLEQTFGLIDQMPMRRQEMRRHEDDRN